MIAGGIVSGIHATPYPERLPVAEGVVGGSASIISPVSQTSSHGGLDLPGELTPERLDHVLGGHRAGAGRPGATEFPEDWTDQDVVDAIDGVYWGGEESDDTEADTEGGVVLEGEYRGVRTQVVVDRDGRVRTAYPLPGQEEQGVRENPEEEDQ